MSILIDKNTKVVCQGFTGSQGTLHSEQALAYAEEPHHARVTSSGKSVRYLVPTYFLCYL